MDIDLGPGQVTGVRFPVHVDKVGRQTMTVKGTGATVADAVARSVLVVPDGQAVPVAASGTLGAGTITSTVNFPAAAVAGSQQLYLNVYPAYLSQVIGGMDSLLRVPNGCFEQSTSTAWPNVLVTAYLKQTKQVRPEIRKTPASLQGTESYSSFETIVCTRAAWLEFDFTTVPPPVKRACCSDAGMYSRKFGLPKASGNDTETTVLVALSMLAVSIPLVG
jgi:hypothetical protein